MEMETELRRQLVHFIEADFLIREDVSGIHLIEGRGVSIDLLLFPRKHLADSGFPQEWIGVEVKHIPCFRSGDSGKKSRLVWQAITYTQSLFDMGGEQIRPLFVLVYVGQDEFDEDEFGRDARVKWIALLNLAWYANVGSMITDARRGWIIKFAGGVYYSQCRGRGNVRLRDERLVGSIR